MVLFQVKGLSVTNSLYYTVHNDNMVDGSIASIYNLGDILTSALCASANMSPQVVYISYRHSYLTICNLLYISHDASTYDDTYCYDKFQLHTIPDAENLTFWRRLCGLSRHVHAVFHSSLHEQLVESARNLRRQYTKVCSYSPLNRKGKSGFFLFCYNLSSYCPYYKYVLCLS